MKKFLLILSVFSSNVCTGCFWDNITANIDVTSGFRTDHIETRVNTYNPSGTLVSVDKLNGNHLHIYEIGIRGELNYCDIFLKGYADFGRVVSGSYFESLALPLIPTEIVKGNANKGHTNDYSIGLGYFINFCNYLKIGPAVGYSYDKQKFKIHDVESNEVSDTILNNLGYEMCWQGPWLGIESRWLVCNILCSCGYEYHWSRWQAKWQLNGPDTEDAFSDKRKSNHAHGNVFFLDGRYNFWRCWNFGIGLKYQYWNAGHGNLVPLNFNFTTEEAKVPKAIWRSFQVQFRLGYEF